MVNNKSYEYDCTKKCCFRPHGNSIVASLTKRSIPDDKLAAFIAKSCCNFSNNVDELGRTALHLAASVDRYAVLEWLLNQGAYINIRDYESGSTALHRAIYYGCIDCAVLLMRYGASLEVLDEDTRCPLQSVCRLSENVASSNDLLVWGSNKNYNLGIDNDSKLMTPQLVEHFRKEHIFIEKVALGAYHSLFLDKKSHLYTVGHGKGGRLGNGSENTQPVPKKVKVPMKNTGEKIICISASRNHSLVLTDHSAVFACGLNDNHQLGVREAGDKLTVFKEVVTLRDLGVKGLVRVIARDEHSLAYSESCIYCWGTNYGQLNVEETIKVVPLPRLMRLPPRTQINFVESSDIATVVVTKENVIHLFYKNKLKSLKTPNFEGIKCVSVVGGDNPTAAKSTATALKLLILTQTNAIFFWHEIKQQYFGCTFSQIRLTQIDKIFYNANQVLILSQGDVYTGKCNQIPMSTNAQIDEGFTTPKVKKSGSTTWSRCENNQTEVSQSFMIRMDLQHLPQIDRAVDIFSNYDFSSFSVLQESNLKYFRMPKLLAEEYTFKKLYNDADAFDTVHDLIFHVDGETFPAHKLIIYARSHGLRNIVENYIDKKDIHLNYERLSAKMFEIMMKFMYMNYLPNESDLEDIQTSLGPDSPNELLETGELFLEFVEKFQLTNLANYLKSFIQLPPFYLPTNPDKSKYRFNRLRLKDFPELYDVRIICSDDVTIEAHKCVLVARLEYFDMMFSHTWAEQSTINLSTVPFDYMLPIIEFLYTADVDGFRRQNHSEGYLYNMVVYCDQFFVESLRKVCEMLILERISIRKCSEMLDFASIYNCKILKDGCLTFICQNLARMLHFRYLEHCEPEALKSINTHYRNMFKDVFDYRMITPDSDAIDDDLLLSFVDDFQVDLEYRMDEKEQEKNANKAKGGKDQKSSQYYGSRQYERDAITSMLESLKLLKNSNSNREETNKSNIVLEAQQAAEKLQQDAKSWMKVPEKKDLNKKRLSFENALKANEIILTEDKPKEQFTSLRRPGSAGNETKVIKKTPEKERKERAELKTPIKTPLKHMPIEEHETPTTSSCKIFNFNLADLKATPNREKLSQKQRKRLSSSSSELNQSSNDTLGKLVGPTAPKAIPVPVQPNAWGTLPQSPSSPVLFGTSSPLTGTSEDPTSFANMARATTRSAMQTQTQSPNNSFSKILEEERKQRDYFERMRNKSLVLTQIEEQAITELREFYNADNATDEIITIERKCMPPSTLNFAVWHHR